MTIHTYNSYHASHEACFLYSCFLKICFNTDFYPDVMNILQRQKNKMFNVELRIPTREVDAVLSLLWCFSQSLFAVSLTTNRK